MKKRNLAVSLTLAAAMALTTACSGGSQSSSTPDTTAAQKKEAAADTSAAEGASSDLDTSNPITIAVAAPMTGDNSEYGIGFANAAKLMAEKWNEDGGCLGREVKIVEYDDKNTSEEATTIAQKIVSDKDNIAGVIGHFASGVCMTAAPIYQENGVIEISPSSSHPDYSSIGDYIFRNNTVISKEGGASVDIAVNDLGKKKIGIISIMTDWGTNTSKIITDIISGMSDQGVSVVAHEDVMEGSDDYSAAIAKLNDAGAEAVICCGMYNLVAPVAKQYKQVNPDVSIIAFSNAYSQQLLELGGSAVNGVCFPVIFFADSDDPEIQAYVKQYTDVYGAAPSALTSQAYDSVGMLLTAIENAGTTESDKVKDEIYKVDYPGVTGQTKFDSNGDVDKEFVKVTIEDGKFVKMK